MGKEAIRERVWDRLEDQGVARFPYPPHGRIPNFDGADRAADRLAGTREWTDAAALKANPDAPQLPVRRAALQAGMSVSMAVPRLREAACFYRLDPTEITDLDHAATIGGAGECGKQVEPTGLKPIDLVVVGSVAVDERGGRIGKGEGYSDLEFALLAEVGRLDPATTAVVTTVHELQVLDDPVPVAPYDVPLDLVVTPSRVIRTETALDRPTGIDWTALSPERIETIPVLEQVRERR